MDNWRLKWDRDALRRHLEAARDDDVAAIQKAARELLEKMASK